MHAEPVVDLDWSRDRDDMLLVTRDNDDEEDDDADEEEESEGEEEEERVGVRAEESEGDDDTDDDEWDGIGGGCRQGSTGGSTSCRNCIVNSVNAVHASEPNMR